MQDVQLFQLALGLTPPWQVTGSTFDADQRQLDLQLDFAPGATFACPQCAAAGCPVHDTVAKTWRHLDFFQYAAYLHARTPRVRCGACGVRLVAVPWARPGSGFTLLFEALVMTLVKEMAMAALARLVREHDTRLWRIVAHYVEQARAAAAFSAEYAAVRHVGVDETASKRGQHYITLFVDAERARLLYATAGRDAATVAAFRADLEAHGGAAERIRDVCLDMSPAFIRGVTDAFPAAQQTFDKFHVMQLLGAAVDAVRRAEQQTRPELRGTRYVWTKNPENLTPRQFAQWAQLTVPALRLKTARAYQLRLTFQEFWALRGAEAEAFLTRWYAWATRSRLPPIVEAAKTIKRHWAGVLRWAESGLTNGLLEGINSLVQAAKAKARGYRSPRTLITMAYLLAGKLDFRPQPT